ncbi:26s proteasome complex subunit sem1 [Anaeramoeba flamelloides]|uniref:26s proteasome complex subunit sem1 n=1 Tax=Anaeramoeba flamelloides TaxID=1746091 RepID=A0AAV7ZS97_9EUKA|nr:26s proteasome complex subunit sem1 [Anaeramoeba flamelloides]KAJ6252392.1 26s proteasome complex subunit sem1 [Anaeramoeba flamelloides]
MSNKQKTTSEKVFEALEEDDEFEEFEQDWGENEKDQEDQVLWRDDWDEDDIEDELVQQLRVELQKSNEK